MRDAVTTFLTQFPVVTLFGVIGIGYLLGQVRIFGFRLGVAGVLFAGLAAGALGPDVALPSIVSTIGLILFIYSIGIQFGPTFSNPFRRAALGDSVFCMAMLVLGALAAIGVASWRHLAGPALAGLFSGALTNAPALAAAQEVLRDNSRGLPAAALQQLIDGPVISFGIAYPFGVLGVMLSFQLYRTLFHVKQTRQDPAEAIEVRDFVVQNPGVTGQPLAELLRVHKDLGFVISRIRSGGQTVLATPESRLSLGDIVAVVGSAASFARALQLFGEPSELRIERDRGVLDYRRVFVSNPAVIGKPVRELNLQANLSATITRLRRGDIDIVPTGETRLESGDRVRVLTAPANFDAVARFFGDSIRGTAETDFASVGLGMAMGVILGLIPVPLPGGALLRLGLAGGPLIAGLVLGRLQRTGPISWTIPLAANLTLRQIGLVLFQAGVGTRAGYGFLQTVRGSGLEMIVSGAVVTATVALASLFIGHRIMGQPFEKVMGLTCAIHTEPASLAFASLISNSDAPNASYARVFPVCTVAKIVLAQLLVTWRG
ncbi:MAG: aspartate:alanine exchanger family transporter [Candidatus Solibacter sp.]